MAQQEADTEMSVSHIGRAFAGTPGKETQHPQFSNGDVVLVSKDGVIFNVHRIILTSTSTWFNTLFTLPQPRGATARELLRLDEDSIALTALLQVVCGLGLPDIQDIDAAETLLTAAEKYDMVGPISFVRKIIMLPPIISSSPLRVYSLACQWNWEEEARLASTSTLSLDLCSASSMEQLRRCRMSIHDLAKLVALHRSRRDRLRDSLYDTRHFSANMQPPCTQCSAELAHTEWREFKDTLVRELESRPFGAELSIDDLWLRLSIFPVLSASCPHCKNTTYNMEMTLKKLRDIIDDLPKHV